MCQGGGLVMTLMSDLAVVSDRATFRVPELLRGVADCYLGARLASRVGVARAKWLLFTAQPFSAAEALAMGLVSRVVPHDRLDAAVAETIGWIRQTGPRARTALKRDLNRQLPALDLADVRRLAGVGRGARGVPGLRREAAAPLGPVAGDRLDERTFISVLIATR